jgi:GT2 family glycosyltransferase
MTEQSISNRLTVVIPTIGRDCLRDSVKAIANGSMLPAQLVIAHQGPIGALDKMLQEFAQLGLNVRYIHSDKTGPGPCRNDGISCVATDFFATTDDDCLADSEWIKEVTTALTQHPRAIVTGRVLASEPGAPSVATSQQARIFTSAPLQGNHFCGGNFGVALAIFNDVGPFDESELVRFCEDPEWAYRALAKGYRIHYLPQITVTHLHWRDNKNMEMVYRNYARSQGGWFGRRLRQGDMSFLVRLAYELMRGAKRWFVGSLNGDYLRKVNGRAYVVDLLRGLGAGFNRQ